MNQRLDPILSRLQRVKGHGDNYTACCPAHEDKEPSLSITYDAAKGMVKLKCHAGCDTADVIASLGLDWSDLFDEKVEHNAGKAEIIATYDYTDEGGNLLYQAVRYHPKGFKQRRPLPNGDWDWKLGDIRRVPYHLPALMEGIGAGRRAFVVEGEKDVHTLEALGLIATTSAGGAQGFRRDLGPYFEGAHVVVLPDNDQAGEEYAIAVSDSVSSYAHSVLVVRLPDLPHKGDVSDWIAAGHTLEELKAEIREPRPQLPGDVQTLDVGLDFVGKYSREPLPAAIEYPWRKVNWLTHGVRPGWLVYMAGDSGSGKTAAALELILLTARKGKRVLFVSMEMSLEEIGVRVSQRWGLDSEAFYSGMPTVNEEQAVDTARNMESVANVVVAHTNELGRIEELVARLQPELCVIDYLGLISIDADSRVEGTTRVSHKLKAMARKYEVGIISLVQLSRDKDRSSRNRVPTMHDLKDSSSLEQDADQVLLVHRTVSDDDRTMAREGRFIVGKARMGKTGSCPFEFDGESQTFLIPTSHEYGVRA